jgi:peptidoglycan biosynthesis protein MviN/MurJ (putative lipid II flippase)
VAAPADAAPARLPPPRVWLWAVLGAGLPLALPFAARSAASQAGEGALASFNYAWKLVELPLILAIQLVASLAFPAIARAAGDGASADAARAPARQAFALAWTLGCAAAAGLLLGGPALARLLFGWGRMAPEALEQVARWGMAGAWGLLPQAVTAVALTVLATRRRMAPAALGYALALAVLLGAAALGLRDGGQLMWLLNAAQLVVALVCLAALGAQRSHWLPWATFGWAASGLAACALAGAWLRPAGLVAGLACGALGALAVIALAAWRSSELRQALRR